MKGIVLAGGTGSRLWPVTLGVSKQLLPVYDKPMIYYPISTLMLAGIDDILLITNKEDSSIFKRVLGDGSQFGVKFNYEIQEYPRGLVEAFIIGEQFMNDEPVTLILGDNIFYGQGLGTQLQRTSYGKGAHIFASRVRDPERYGVVELSGSSEILSLEEKPISPKSNLAVTGLYFFDKNVCKYSKEITPGRSGELEILSLLRVYLERNMLSVSLLERGTAWLDAGTFDSLLASSSFIKTIEDRQGLKVGSLEEIAWRNKWITDEDLLRISEKYGSTSLGLYLTSLVRN